MALVDQVTLSADATFIGRVRQSMIASAIAIQNEAITVAFHPLRVQQAKAIMNGPDSFSPLFAKAVATDATVQASAGVPANQANVTDANINAAVSAMWNSFFSIF